ncbi:MAG: hypothetical protein A2289_07735 [Deltaproteobacteria bacterium RIFOXYA12_FULL_58_15]|nr:MAG: hypothetical protein A2289_07735 [Deltaproteobacteria bacterium RIFOXYA12_FULL_58_15]
MKSAMMLMLMLLLAAGGCDDGKTNGGSDGIIIGDDQRVGEAFCDGIDNNEDGAADEDYFVTDGAGNQLKIGDPCGVGACAGGTVVCSTDKTRAVCDSAGNGTAETCDNIDNDCDGGADEDLTTLADSDCLQIGVCGEAGATVVAVCASGAWLCDYHGVPLFEDEMELSCDGLDNNCDGEVDEDFDDTDADKVSDCIDNCPNLANASQTDSDGDGVGDVCDICLGVDNPDQADSDLDEVSYTHPSEVGEAEQDCFSDGICLTRPVAGGPVYNTGSSNIRWACDGCDDLDDDTFWFDAFNYSVKGRCFPDGMDDIGGRDTCLENTTTGQQTNIHWLSWQSSGGGGFAYVRRTPRGDGLGDGCDNCPARFNPDQANSDGDAFGNVCDNCPGVSSSSQADVDGDHIGDACDDSDGDGTLDLDDNCPMIVNPDQVDSDNDGYGNVCDNCPGVANASQSDINRNTVGDACDDLSDNDGVVDIVDNCMSVSNSDQTNSDGDDFGDACDVCPEDTDPDQGDEGERTVVAYNHPEGSDELDMDCIESGVCLTRSDEGGPVYNGAPDGDSIQWTCGPCRNVPTWAGWYSSLNDGDFRQRCFNNNMYNIAGKTVCLHIQNPGDAYWDVHFTSWGRNENSNPEVFSYVRTSDLSDGIGDACDNCLSINNPDQENSDGDSWGDACDNCPNQDNEEQANSDANPVGDACQNSDGDTLLDIDDNCDFTDNEDQTDTDNDQVGDACEDLDDDGYGIGQDNCPGIGNPGQEDTDNTADGVGDVCDNCPADNNPDQADDDLDGVGDVCDNCVDIENSDQSDDDDDGVGDACDNCPYDTNPEQADSDLNGIGDACQDLDEDGFIDSEDNCPYAWNPGQEDSEDDPDGIGDACDNCPWETNGDQEDADFKEIYFNNPAGESLSDCIDDDELVCLWLDLEQTAGEPTSEVFLNLGSAQVEWACGNCLEGGLDFYPSFNQMLFDRGCFDEEHDVPAPFCVHIVDPVDASPYWTIIWDHFAQDPAGVSYAYQRQSGDHVGDVCDNCVDVANPDQGDMDDDELGDACDPDIDGDDDLNQADNCPWVPNPDQLNADGDLLGNACDNCIEVSNDNQMDHDGDGWGNVCDNCSAEFNPDQNDDDEDGVGNACDNCFAVANPAQENSDVLNVFFDHPPGVYEYVADCINDQVCLTRRSRSGIYNALGHTVYWARGSCEGIEGGWTTDFRGAVGYNMTTNAVGSILCLQVPGDGPEFWTVELLSWEPGRAETDGGGFSYLRTARDGMGDACDNCPGVPNQGQEDGDGDAVGEVCDICPNDFDIGQWDMDSDGLGDACDFDIDGDAIDNEGDVCPWIFNPDQADEDEDNVGDLCDNCLGVSNPEQIDDEYVEVDYVHAAGVFETESDCIESDVCLTRGNQGPLYNKEGGFIAWACGTCDSVNEGTDWYSAIYDLKGDCLEGDMRNLVTEAVCLQVYYSNMFWDVDFSVWGSGGTGEFAYVRSMDGYGDGSGRACDNCWYVDNADQADSGGNCSGMSMPYASDPACGDACYQ